MNALGVLLPLFLACAVAGEMRERLLETMERFLKPSTEDTRTEEELRQRISKVERTCEQGICKDFRKTPGKVAQPLVFMKRLGKVDKYPKITKLMILYHDCMDGCTEKEKHAYDRLEELALKSQYWDLFETVKGRMSLIEASFLWTEVKSECPLLLAEQQQMERVERILKPTAADQRLRDELDKRINETEKTCREVECKTLRDELEKGRSPADFPNLLAQYEECMNACKAKEQYSYSKSIELEKKSDYWRNFNEVKEGMSAADALVYWTEIRDEFNLLEEEQAELERIERILKPSTADEYMREELYNRTGEANKRCIKFQKKMVAGERSKGFAELLMAYDQCMNESRAMEQKSYGLLEEIDKKADYWKKFEEVRKGKSLGDALVYWTEINDGFRLLEAEERTYESVLEQMRLTGSEKNLKKKVKAKIREQSENCTEQKCADLRKQISTAESSSRQEKAADQYVSCMRMCKTAVASEIEKLKDLQEKQRRYKAIKKIRDQVSVMAALRYHEEANLCPNLGQQKKKLFPLFGF